jgi:GDSL-like Lipase/Acylhydrolase
MTRNRSFARITAALLFVVLAAVPVFAAHGTADFSHIVALGDSYTAGFSNGSLNERHQIFSPAAIFAQQTGAKLCQPTDSATTDCFAQPLVTWPGIPGELQLTSPSLTGVVAAPFTGVPAMSGFARPYNNLATPGAMLYDILNTTGAEKTPVTFTQATPFGAVVERGLGSQVDQAVAQHPTFVVAWIGGDDFFLGATSGSAVDCNTTPPFLNCLSPIDTFKTQYAAVLDKIIAGAPNAGIVVGDFPAAVFTQMPYTSLIPAIVLDTTLKPVLNNGQPIPLFGIINGAPAGLPLGSTVLLPSATKLLSGTGIPPQLAALPPFNTLPNAGKPLADADVLTPAEQQAIGARITAMNAAIKEIAAARNIPVADVNGLFNRIKAGQVNVAGVPMTAAYITGGAFSLDGNHLTDIGYTLLANEFIKATNNAYGTHVPLAPLSRFFQNNDPDTAAAISGSSVMTAIPTFSSEAIKTMEFFKGVPAQPRLRSTTHGHTAPGEVAPNKQ